MKEMKLKALFPSIRLMMMCLVLIGCGDDPIEVEGPAITLNKHELLLEIGGSERLEASFDPYDTPNTGHTWTSSNPNVASVDETGLVTAIAVGEASIMAKALDGGKTDYCKVTVTAPVIFTFSEWNEFKDSKAATTKITITAKKSWKAQITDSWLTVSPSSGSGNATLTLTAKDNASANARTTTLALVASTGETEQLSVSQPGRTLEVNVAKMSFDCDTKTEQQIEVQTDGKFAVSTDEDWIKFKIISNVVYIGITENLNMDKREGFVNIYLSDLTDGTTLSRMIQISQKGLYGSKGEGNIDRDGYGDDSDNNKPNSDVDVNQEGYGDDENRNQPNGNDSDVDKEGFDDDEDQNQPGNSEGEVNREEYNEDEDLNPEEK